MTNIFDKIIANAGKSVSNANDRQLSEDGFNNKVFNSSRIKMPELNLEQTKVQIKTEEISYHNAPPGISFSMSGSKSVEYAIYSIPLNGDINLFANLVRPYIDRRVTYIEHNILFYKEYSNSKISGNEDLINAIKNRVITLANNVIIHFPNSNKS